MSIMMALEESRNHSISRLCHSAVAFQVMGSVTAQSIPNDQTTILNTCLTIKSLDTHNGWDATNKRYVVQVSGKYHIYGCVCLPLGLGSHAGWDQRWAAVFKNGVQQIQGNSACNLSGVSPMIECVLDLVVGDYIQLGVYQCSGQAMDAKWANTNFSAFCVGL